MIEAKDLAKSYGRVPVLAGTSFTAAPGEPLVIFGPSGCGKTTLLRLVAGLELPDRGEVLLDGVVASRPGWGMLPRARNIGFAFQSGALWPHLTVGQNILFGLDARPKAAAARRLAEVLDIVLLAGFEGRYPAELSGGEARRVGLARALAPEPRHLLLDEPMTSLDETLKERILPEILKAVRRTAAVLLYVTHDAKEAERVSGRAFRLGP
jgi:iron(III) transport system ATP-binding protein